MHFVPNRTFLELKLKLTVPNFCIKSLPRRTFEFDCESRTQNRCLIVGKWGDTAIGMSTAPMIGIAFPDASTKLLFVSMMLLCSPMCLTISRSVTQTAAPVSSIAFVSALFIFVGMTTAERVD